MARFDKLELGGDANRPSQYSEAVRIRRDEKDWLKEADQQRRVGQYENALRFYSRALEEDKSLVGGWLGQVQMLVLLDECPEAALWSRKALELFPSHSELLASQAQAVCRLGDMKQAFALCDGAMKLQGNSAFQWLVRGELLVASRQDVDRHCFDKAQQLNPDWLISLEIGLIYLHYRQPSKALERLRRVIELTQDQYYPWYLQGICQAQLGIAQAAKKSFQRCLELSPHHADAQRHLLELDRSGWAPRRIWRRLWNAFH